jgi:dTMP kinase
VPYIIINGMDGAGKGTQVTRLMNRLGNVVRTREPGGTANAEVIREVLLSDLMEAERLSKLRGIYEDCTELTQTYLQISMKILKREGMNGEAEMYLFAASRAETNEKLVKPVLEEGKVVIGDRSVACSMAYQGHARGLGMNLVYRTNQPALDIAKPDFEIYLTISPEEAQKRLQGRDEINRLDKESMEFHEKVKEGYDLYFKNYCPYPYIYVDASGSEEEVENRIWDHVKGLL